MDESSNYVHCVSETQTTSSTIIMLTVEVWIDVFCTL